MNKNICKRCVNEWANTLKDKRAASWNSRDDYLWYCKKVCCPNEVSGPVRIKKEAPSYCHYALEHLMSGKHKR